MSGTLNIPEDRARRLVLEKQLLREQPLSEKREYALEEIASLLASVQYDPLPVIAPNHYIVFWNRLSTLTGRFQFEDLDKALYERHSLLEFFGLRRVTSIIPAAEFALYRSASQLPLSQGWAPRVQRRLRTSVARSLLRRLREDGPLTKRNLQTEEEKATLQTLFWFVPEVVIVDRQKGVFREAVYAWGPEAIPHVDFDREIDVESAVQEILVRTIGAFGVCTTSHAAFWLGCRVRDIRPHMETLLSDDSVITVRVADQRPTYYVLPEIIDRLEEAPRTRVGVQAQAVHLLTPLDNLVRDQRWLTKLFGYSFKVEYFQKKGMRWHTSILIGDRLVGFIDPKWDRRKNEFIVKEVALREDLHAEEIRLVLQRTVELAAVHRCQVLRLLDAPSSWRAVLEEMGSTEGPSGFTVPVMSH